MGSSYLYKHFLTVHVRARRQRRLFEKHLVDSNHTSNLEVYVHLIMISLSTSKLACRYKELEENIQPMVYVWRVKWLVKTSDNVCRLCSDSEDKPKCVFFSI